MTENLLGTQSQERISPEEQCGFFSSMLLSWVTPLIWKGAKQPITQENLFPLRNSFKNENLIVKWDALWKKQCKEAASKNVSPSIVNTMIRYDLRGWLWIILMRFAADLLQFAVPLLLGHLLDSLSDQPFSISYSLCVALTIFVFLEARSILIRYFLYNVLLYANKMHSILVQMVYRKATSLRNSSEAGYSSGQIINLATIDVDKIVSLLPFVHQIWAAPFQVILALILLVKTIGWSAIGGILLMFLFVPLMYYSSKVIRKCHKKKMNASDERVRLFGEVLSGIITIKSFVWEEAFVEKIDQLRNREIRFLRNSRIISQAVDAANMAAPFLVALVTFGTFVLSSSSNVLDAHTAFVSLAIFNQIRNPMIRIATYVNLLMQASVSNSRLRTFFNTSEATFDETKEGPMTSISTPKTPSFTCIVGSVGAGKSYLLHKMMDNYVNVENVSIAFVGQEPWIFTGTLVENITFGRKFDAELFRKVSEASQLVSDISRLPQRERTMIGDNGSTLSGGQKLRIAIARAFYQQADVYFLDDAFAGLNSKVSQKILDEISSKNGLLKSSSVIMVTNNMEHTKTASKIFVVKDLQVTEEGTYGELEKIGGDFAELLQTIDHNPSMQEEREEQEEECYTTTIEKEKVNKTSEKAQTKKVSGKVYWLYLRAASLKYAIPFLLFLSFYYFLLASRSLWLSRWSDENAKGNRTLSTMDSLSIYAGIGTLEVLCISIAFVFLVLSSQSASLRLHSPFVHSLIYSPIQFHDDTPRGQILNRVSKDFSSIDDKLPPAARQYLQCGLQILTSLLLITYSTPWFALGIVPIAVIYYGVQKFFIPTSRQLKRLESVGWSPVITVLNDAIKGATTIRACGMTAAFDARFSQTLDSYIRIKYLDNPMRRWLTLRLDFLGNVIVLLSSVLAIISVYNQSISAGLVGLSITFALQITDQLQQMVRMIAEMENNVVAVERVKEYIDIEREDSNDASDSTPKNWPDNGTIDFLRYSAEYKKDHPVLSNVSLHLDGGQKLGIIGRTGSGKSSFIRSLVRMIHRREGQILIDGKNIHTVTLSALRNSITLIPQHPHLFTETLRFNLDPLSIHSDSSLWKTLESCQLKSFVATLNKSLDTKMEDSGNSLSTGQQQLLCLARALLNKRKIVMLDEATASMDQTTDYIIQKVIREQFSSSTVLAIAHRVNTVRDFDRIMVVDHGEVSRMGTPEEIFMGISEGTEVE